LPGVGEKTAERFAMHLLRAPRRDVEALGRAVSDLRDRVRLCRRCFGLSDSDICAICDHPARDPSVLCVVAEVPDQVAVERSGAFVGRYHILQGVLSPMDGVGPDDLRIRELMERIADEAVTEVILATGTDLEGDATAAYLSERLAGAGVRITRIASGVPMGGDLKYVDRATLKRALDTRLPF
jgi:recombination protein RecR